MKWTKSVIVLFVIFLASGSSLWGQTTLCWDSSLSMTDRDLEKDFSVLEHIFRKDPNQEVQLLLFNIEVTEKGYRIVDGDWQQLKNDLSNMVYDGGTVYAKLENRIKHENVYVFTDGKSILMQDALPLKPKSFIVNSSGDRNIDFLNRTVLLTKSRLMDFASNLPKNRISTESVSKSETIKGSVYIDNRPVPGVRITIKGKEDVVMTDVDGNFAINAQIGDSILVSSVANNTYKNLRISSKENTKVFLEPNIYTLEEVTLVEERTKKLATTGLGKVDKDRLGYDVQSIGDEDITLINTTVSSAVQGKFAGVRHGQNEDLSQVLIRNGSSSLTSNNYALIVVDNVPLRQSNSSTQEIVDTSYLNPDNIADITVLKGLAATNRFGSLGANGVLMITTKAAVAAKKGEKNYDSARLRNNIFDGKLNIKGNTSINYIEELSSSPNFEDAYAIYLLQRQKYDKLDSYYLDVYDFFKPRNGMSAMRIASNIMERDKTDYGQLRGLFLKASKNKDSKLQYLVASKLLEDFPGKTQSYYDMALAHINSSEYQPAMDIFLSIMDGSANRELTFDGLHKRVRAELKDLISKHKKDLDLSQVPPAYLESTTFNARLVFDWNDENTEFDLQFVNPQKRFFEWEHTDFGNKDRIRDELRNGYSSEQFVLTGDGLQGKWIVNISYKGKRTETENGVPTFIKCRLDYNFGFPNSRYEEYELRLTEKSDRQFFFEFKI
ncbi:TonB-dependent receptor plug domain-containing protein [Croceitalea rosinachiae]|uniref:TonB-dependent receptor plug domain-containing protein n=1 Tax=Croceitalea rosinachiae TaxID=3075596 RepID=A0ABU3AB20_9FLAO|nr:TonB-dependent receptor plug domain-containing protein [Croceitalea sp. F388]MDT0607375.1 TonB-dependent receptor plug domain-containing protein [Croceitalea sp. F388]